MSAVNDDRTEEIKVRIWIVGFALIGAYLLGESSAQLPPINFNPPVVMIWPPLPRGYECASPVGPCTFTGIDDGVCTGVGSCAEK